ncbi:MAG: hypothetical protein WBD18_07365, partial [Phycisphaerae bacterium]
APAPAPEAAPGAAPAAPNAARILFLHHSTGECVWNGGVADWFDAYNAAHGTRYAITEQAFPKDSPYGWENYPYDYWNIWVKNAGPKPFQKEPTLEILAPKYDLIVWKHCFPVSSIEADTGQPDVASSEKRIENYKLQYAALKAKMREFPKVRFLVWTGAALVKGETDAESARRACGFFNWVRNEWDEKGDNIFLWDFYALETERRSPYLKDAYAAGDSHPNEAFSRKVAPLFCRRIVDVVQGRGDTGSLKGEGGADVPPPEAPPELQPESPAPTSPTVPLPEPVAAEGAWVFDDAEDPARCAALWGDAAGYVEDTGARVIRLNFADAPEEDWGEYGKQRVVFTRPLPKNHDLRPYRYLALHMKADREMEVVLTLVTLPDPAGRPDQPHFGFTAYLHPPAGQWKTVTLDLGKLELAVEGERAYESAGNPPRPNDLTMLKFSTNAKNQKAAFLVEDITFYRDLPESLRGTVLEP